MFLWMLEKNNQFTSTSYYYTTSNIQFVIKKYIFGCHMILSLSLYNKEDDDDDDDDEVDDNDK